MVSVSDRNIKGSSVGRPFNMTSCTPLQIVDNSARENNDIWGGMRRDRGNRLFHATLKLSPRN